MAREKGRAASGARASSGREALAPRARPAPEKAPKKTKSGQRPLSRDSLRERIHASETAGGNSTTKIRAAPIAAGFPADGKRRRAEQPVGGVGRSDGGGGRIRTYVGVHRQIYSLLPLTTRAPLRAAPCPGAKQAGLASPTPPAGPWQKALELVKGLEPITCRLQGGCSAKLSYTSRI